MIISVPLAKLDDELELDELLKDDGLLECTLDTERLEALELLNDAMLEREELVEETVPSAEQPRMVPVESLPLP